MFRFAYLALKDLFHYRGRTALAVAGIGVVVAVYFTLAGVAEGLGNLAGNAGSARNLLLVDARTILVDDASIPPQVSEVAAEVPGVARVVPMLFRHVRVGEAVVHLQAVPLESYREAHNPSLVEGEWLRQGGVMVGESLAKLEGWTVGDRLNIAGEEFELIGLFRAEGFKNSLIWLSLEDGRRTLGRGETYSQILALLSAEADAEGVRRRLEHDLDPHDVDVYFEQGYFQQVNQSMERVRGVVLMVSGVALLAIVFGVFNVTSMAAAEKRREVGILKANGVGGRQIAGIFLTEGLALAVGGFLLGLAAGAGIVAWLSASSAVSLADVALQPALTPGVVALGAGVTLVLGLLGAWLPARGAATVSVVEALRG